MHSVFYFPHFDKKMETLRKRSAQSHRAGELGRPGYKRRLGCLTTKWLVLVKFLVATGTRHQQWLAK